MDRSEKEKPQGFENKSGVQVEDGEKYKDGRGDSERVGGWRVEDRQAGRRYSRENEADERNRDKRSKIYRISLTSVREL